MADIDRIAREGAELAWKATKPPWSADDSAECWRLHGTAFHVPAHGGIPEQRATLQILKAPKHGTPYAEYWPNEHDAALILHAVNSHAALCRAVIERGEEVTALRARVAELEGRGAKPWQPREGRCDICDWTLAESRDKGCVPGDCSYRPTEGTDEWLRIKARRVEVERQRVEHARGGAT